MHRNATLRPLTTGFNAPAYSKAHPKPTADATTNETAINSSVGGKCRRISTGTLPVKIFLNQETYGTSPGILKTAKTIIAMGAAVAIGLRSAVRRLSPTFPIRSLVRERELKSINAPPILNLLALGSGTVLERSRPAKGFACAARQ